MIPDWRGLESLEPRRLLTVVNLVATDPLAAESPGVGDPGEFTFTRDDTAGDLVVSFSTFGPASDGVDFEMLLAGDAGQPFNGSVTIPDGSFSVTLAVIPIDDNIKENQNGNASSPYERVDLRLNDGDDYDRGSNIQANVYILDDDQDEVPVSIFANDAIADIDGPNTGTFTIVRAGDTSAPLDVFYSFGASGGATSGADFQIAPAGMVTIPAGQFTSDITVTPLQGGAIGVDYDVSASLVANFAYDNVFIFAINRVIAVDVSDLPTVELGISDLTAIEPADPAEFLITRTGDTTDPLVVHFTISDNDAINGVDFQLITSPVTIPAGADSVEIPIVVIDDLEDEAGTEFMTLTLIPSPGPNPTYNIGSTGSKIANINDNDSDTGPVASVSVVGSTATEDGGTVRFSITRTEDNNGEIEIFFTIGGTAQNGIDYQAIPNSVVLPNLTRSMNLTIVPIDDANPEPLESITLTVVEGPGYILNSNPALISRSANLADNDGGLAEVEVFADTLAVEGASQGKFRLTRTESTSQTLTVFYQVSGEAVNGTDYSLLSEQVTFPIGADEVTVNFNPIDDSDIEGGDDGIESIIFTIVDNAAYQVGLQGQVTGGILDDDQPAGTPTVTITSLDPVAKEDTQDPATFTVTRSGSTISPLTIDLIVSGTTVAGDYISVPTSVTIIGGSALATTTVVPIDDLIIEDLETIIIDIASSANYDIGANNAVTLTIEDNDAPIVLPNINLSANDPNANEVGGTGQFTITRDGNVNNALEVFYTIAGDAINGTDYQSIVASATILGGSTSITIDINPINDGLVEGNETVTLSLSPSAVYVVGNADTGTVTISDDEVQTLVITVGDTGEKELLVIDADGTGVKIKQKIGDAQITLTSNTVFVQTQSKKRLTVTGTNLQIVSIELISTQIKSKTSIKTDKNGDGITTIQDISGDQLAGKLDAKQVDLIGQGIVMTGNGAFGSVTVRDILGGADIIMPGTGVAKGVQITATMLEAGSDITLGSGLKKLKAASWDASTDASTLTAPTASKIDIKSDKKRSITALMDADIMLTGQDSKGVSLGNLNVKGLFSGDIMMPGSANSITAERFEGSRIYAGFNALSFNNPFLGGTFADAQIKKLTAKGTKGSQLSAFVNTFVAARTIGRVTLGVVDTTGNTANGILTDGTIKSVKLADPKFKFDNKGGTNQDVGDFHIHII